MTLFNVCRRFAKAFPSYHHVGLNARCISMKASSMEAAREYLHKFAGGAVTVETNPTNGIAIITISNPAKRNAMSGRMMVELHDRISELSKWAQGKAVILRGAAGNFCSGGDLDFARASGTPDGAAAMNLWMCETLTQLTQLPLISVCLAEGPTLGGGVEISLACDYILVADDVKYGVVHARLGIVPVWGGGTRLVRRIGPRRALDLLLTTRVLAADECLQFGIADEVVAKRTALDEVERWLQPRLQHQHVITRALKRIVNAAAAATTPQSLEEAMSLESRVCRQFWGGELNREALAQHVRHLPPAAKES